MHKLLFKLRLKKPVILIRALGRRRRRHKPFFFNTKAMSSPSSSFFSVFRSPKRSKHTNKKFECLASPSIDEPEVEPVVFALPDRDPSGCGRQGCDDGEVEEACRSFEKYLVKMIVEEGKTKDLMDVEELLYCWKKLKCPVFIDLISRFYGELCKDLFSSHTLNDEAAHLPH